MNKEWGVFAVHRGIWDHAFFEREPFTQREAWMWLISAAAWKPVSVGMCGKVIPIERGEFCFSLRFLAEKFRWQKDKVARFLLRCTKHDMMRDTERDTIKVYKIVKYNDYQIVGLPKRDSKQDASRDTTETRPRHDRDKEETFKHSNTKEQKQVTSAEPPAAHAPPDPVFISLPTNREGEEVPIQQSAVDDYARTYPGVCVPQEFREMRRWLIDNRGRRKTANGMSKFVNGWLAKEQDKGGVRSTQAQPRASPINDEPYVDPAEEYRQKDHENLN